MTRERQDSLLRKTLYGAAATVIALSLMGAGKWVLAVERSMERNEERWVSVDKRLERMERKMDGGRRDR